MATTLEQSRDVDPRVRRTRKLLLQAFTDLQKEKSISSISVQDIAERATVNRATFYAHFEDKYALMYAWIREEFRQVLAGKLSAPTALTAGSLHVVVRAVFDFLGGFYSSCKRSDRQLEPMFETAMQQELRLLLLAWLKGAAHSSHPRSGASLETTAEVLSWAIFGPAVHWSRGDRSRSAEEMSHEVLAVVVSGLAGVVGPVPES
jgi:AcrR family transcriptional regulator